MLKPATYRANVFPSIFIRLLQIFPFPSLYKDSLWEPYLHSSSLIQHQFFNWHTKDKSTDVLLLLVGARSYLRMVVRVSVMVLQRFNKASSLCGSSFRNLTASTSTLSTTRILLCRPGNWSAGESRRQTNKYYFNQTKHKCKRSGLSLRHWAIGEWLNVWQTGCGWLKDNQCLGE